MKRGARLREDRPDSRSAGDSTPNAPKPSTRSSNPPASNLVAPEQAAALARHGRPGGTTRRVPHVPGEARNTTHRTKQRLTRVKKRLNLAAPAVKPLVKTPYHI